MNTHIIVNLFLNIGFFVVLFMIFITWPLLTIILSRHFDPCFPEFVHDKNAFERGWWILNPFMRACRYMSCILGKDRWKKSIYCQYYFGHFDFRAHARKIDWLIIFLHLGAVAMIGFLGIIIFILNGFHLPST